jgi:3',5'-cyclic-nucleotide phosphodiesterase
MRLRILGCHGGTSLAHRNVAFLVDERLALDAGSLAGGLTLEEQASIEAVLVSHAHIDHVGELAAICDVRAQQGGPGIVVAGIQPVLAALREHFFNDVLWPDFSAIPSTRHPALRWREIEAERASELCGFSLLAVPVHHSVPCTGFVLDDGRASIAYGGDTGPTDRLWRVLDERPNLRAVVLEVSFPDRLGELARRSGHLTPRSFRAELEKLRKRSEISILVYGLKPLHEHAIADEVAALGLENVRLLAAGQSLEF